VERDHGQVRQVLVIEKIGKAELDLRQPVVEKVLAPGERLARPLDEEIMDRVVV